MAEKYAGTILKKTDNELTPTLNEGTGRLPSGSR